MAMVPMGGFPRSRTVPEQRRSSRARGRVPGAHTAPAGGVRGNRQRALRRVGAALGLVWVIIAGVVAPVVEAVAPGCDSRYPTFVGGPIYGDPDNRSLNAMIGVDHADASGRKVDAHGILCGQPGHQCCGGYSWCEWINRTIPPEGSPDTSLKRTWGRCVTSEVTQVFIEIYPKDQTGATNKSRYGAAAHYHQPVTVDGNNDAILLRLPLTYEAGHGNTGSVNGYITYHGHRIPPEHLTRIRAFTTGRGPQCGVEGFSAAPDAKAYSRSRDATYYRISSLAGGRCGADSQRYTLYVDCEDFCGGGTKTLQQSVDISKGTRRRVDFAF